MKKIEWIKYINDRQDYYVELLIKKLKENSVIKTINFNSPTGSGKTIMIARLIEKLATQNYFFLVSTLSKGSLSKQIDNNLKRNIKTKNFIVFGSSSYKANTKIQANDILKAIPIDSKFIWIRDEGHIKTNKWSSLLENKALKIINVSATNSHVDIQCNFTDTPLLRIPYQLYGTPEDSIKKLIYVKEVHKNVSDYNPCLIVRDVANKYLEEFVDLCKKYKLKFINISEKTYDMHSLAENNNKYDVIINKLKITEGIDIPRASVIFIGNCPKNEATTIQLIGRVRRNALLWNKDIDIFDEQNKKLLEETSKTYIFYNEESYSVKTQNNELTMELSNLISIEKLIPSKLYVKDNCLENGYKINELGLLPSPYSGDLIIKQDNGFNIIENIPNIYKKRIKKINEFGEEYKEIIQDKELVKISLDKSKYYRINGKGEWKVTKSVSDNISYGKLPSFIKEKYKKEISNVNIFSIKVKKAIQNTTFTGNKLAAFNLLKKTLIKFFLFGEDKFDNFIQSVRGNLNNENKIISENKILLLSLTSYCQSLYSYFYGSVFKSFIPSLSNEDIINVSDEEIDSIFSDLKIISSMIEDKYSFKSQKIRNPHIGSPLLLHGLVDIITSKEIFLISYDKKNYDTQIIKGLSYHFLSTKRNDVKIEKVIIFFLDTCELAEITIEDNNINRKFYEEPIFNNDFRLEPIESENFKINRILSFYNSNGKEKTLINLETIPNKSMLIQKKETQEFIKNSLKIDDIEIQKEVLNKVKPSKAFLKYALNHNLDNIALDIIDNINLSSLEIDKIIKTNKINIILKVAELNEISVSNVLSVLFVLKDNSLASRLSIKVKKTEYNRKLLKKYGIEI